MASIYDIAEEEYDLKREIERLIREAEGELTPEIEDKIQKELQLSKDGKKKLEGYYKILQEIKASRDAKRQEAERLMDAADRDDRAVSQLEENVKFYIENVREVDELRTNLCTFKINSVGGKRSIELKGGVDEYPHEVKKYTVKVDFDGSLAEEGLVQAFIDQVNDVAEEKGVGVKVAVRVQKSLVREWAGENGNALVRFEPRKTYLSY